VQNIKEQENENGNQPTSCTHPLNVQTRTINNKTVNTPESTNKQQQQQTTNQQINKQYNTEDKYISQKNTNAKTIKPRAKPTTVTPP